MGCPIHGADILSRRSGDNSSFRGKLMACRWIFKILRPNRGLIFGPATATGQHASLAPAIATPLPPHYHPVISITTSRSRTGQHTTAMGEYAGNWRCNVGKLQHVCERFETCVSRAVVYENSNTRRVGAGLLYIGINLNVRLNLAGGSCRFWISWKCNDVNVLRWILHRFCRWIIHELVFFFFNVECADFLWLF